jgi:hypothetical protein
MPKKLPTAIAAFAALIALAVSAAPGAASGFDASALPRCWKVTSTYRASGAELDAFGHRFGVTVAALSNYKVDAGGIPLQVNVVTCAEPADAKTVYEFFMTARSASRSTYTQDDTSVYEFLCDNTGVRSKMQDLMGLYPGGVNVYKIRFELAPLEKSDDTRWNALFNAFLSGGDVHAFAPDFAYSRSVILRDEHPSWGAPSYAFSPEPASRSTATDALNVAFGEDAVVDGVPRVTVEATVPVKAFAAYVPGEPANAYRLTRATDAWPTTAPEVASAFDDKWNAGGTFLEKVAYIQCRVHEIVKYGGDETGSRHGTVQTLQQGYGHCWDMSDVVVTMCRYAGIPAREVMGWHTGFGQGHVWVEAYDVTGGWVSLDATATWIGVDVQYVPFFILDDGRVPFVYTSMPELEGMRSAGDGRR